jgi:hypothetical protein
MFQTDIAAFTPHVIIDHWIHFVSTVFLGCIFLVRNLQKVVFPYGHGYTYKYINLNIYVYIWIQWKR